MTTNKNRVNAYIDDETYYAFNSYCKKWQCSQSKGVELVIRQYLIEGNTPNVTYNVPDISTDNELSDILTRLEKLEGNVSSNTPNVTQDEIKEEIKEAIALSLKPIENSLFLINIDIDRLNSRLQSLEARPIIPSPIPDTIPPIEVKTVTIPPDLDDSSEVEENVNSSLNPSQGVSNIQLSKEIGLTDPSLVSHWKKGARIPEKTGKHYETYQRFLEWEEKKGKWFKKKPTQ